MSYLPSLSVGNAHQNGFIKRQMDYFRLSMQKNDDDKNNQPSNVPKGFEKFFRKKKEDKEA